MSKLDQKGREMSKSILDQRFAFSGKMPIWAQWLLRDAGIPDEFVPAELTEDQHLTLSIVVALKGLVDKGLVKVKFESEEEGPLFSSTAQGLWMERALKEQRKGERVE